MSKADASASPPYPPDTEHRNVLHVLHRREEASEWAVEQTIVGEHVHIVAKCFCDNCIAIRAEQDERDFNERPQHRWFGKCSLAVCPICDEVYRDIARMADEDLRDQQGRAQWRMRA